jgi:hypothetical protein
MRKEYDFSHSVKNPYTKKLKKPISIRIDPDTIEYFKRLAEETGIPYQNLMNHYLADCASKGLKPSLVWQKKGAWSVEVLLLLPHLLKPSPSSLSAVDRLAPMWLAKQLFLGGDNIEFSCAAESDPHNHSGRQAFVSDAT